jgi:hypothetical protein
MSSLVDRIVKGGISVEVNDANPFDDGIVSFIVKVKVLDLMGKSADEHADAALQMVDGAKTAAAVVGIPWLDKMIGKVTP